jgi:hypothetical protein
MHFGMKARALITSLVLLSACSAETTGLNLPVMDLSSASPPSRITASQPEPVDPAADVVNLAARSELTIGMVMEIRITSGGPELMNIGIMQVRKSPRGATIGAGTQEARRDERAQGHWVTIEAYSKGALVSRTAVSDPELIAVEGTGLTQLKERTVYASVPMPRRVDTIEITATAGGEAKRIDVSKVVDHYCNSAPNERACHSP